jgi:pimeloyl-ACP methyl ester carboxylesterase
MEFHRPMTATGSVGQIVPILFYFKSAQEYLHAALWLPKVSRGEGLVFCHGWGGGSQYDDLLEALADNGYFALRFHQRGYGESSGRSDLSLWAADMAAAAAVLGPITKKVWAAGQSTGGTMALVAAATQKCFAGAVSLAPFCTLQQILLDNSEARLILESRFGPLQEKDYQAADAMAVIKALTKPVLLIHGTKDETVPITHGRQLAQSAGDSVRFVAVEGGNHHLRNVDRGAIIKEITGWLISH